MEGRLEPVLSWAAGLKPPRGRCVGVLEFCYAHCRVAIARLERRRRRDRHPAPSGGIAMGKRIRLRLGPPGAVADRRQGGD